MLGRDAAAGRTAGLSRFELLAVGDTAADLFDDLAQGGAHGDLDQTGVVDLAAESKDLGALGLLGAHAGKPVRTLEDDLRNVGVGFDVVQDGRLGEQALHGRERRTGTGLAAVTLDGGHQSGLLAAHEGAGAQTDVDVEVKAGVENVLAQQAVFAGLLDGNLQTLNGDRVLRANVDEALVGADRIAGDRHGFEDRVGVALQNRSVHEGAGVALVGVAADILLIRLVGGGKSPLFTGGEAGAAAAAEAGGQDDVDDLLRRHLGQNLAQSGITVHRDVFIDVLRVDHAAVAERNALLRAVESGVVEGDVVLFDRKIADVAVLKALDDTALQQVLFHDLRDVLLGNAAVEGSFGVNNDDGAQSAETEATGLNDLNFILQALGFQFLGEGLLKHLAAGRGTTGTAANQYV